MWRVVNALMVLLMCLLCVPVALAMLAVVIAATIHEEGLARLLPLLGTPIVMWASVAAHESDICLPRRWYDSARHW